MTLICDQFPVELLSNENKVFLRMNVTRYNDLEQLSGLLLRLGKNKEIKYWIKTKKNAAIMEQSLNFPMLVSKDIDSEIRFDMLTEVIVGDIRPDGSVVWLLFSRDK